MCQKVSDWEQYAITPRVVEFFHGSSLGGHSRVYVTIHKLTSVVYWKGLRCDVREFVRKCKVCQQFKPENVASQGLLKPPLVPDGVFTHVTMDFIKGIPRSKGKTTIMVVVDRLTNYERPAALPHPYTAQIVAKLFLDMVYKLHGLPNSITTERDPIFPSNFWQELFRM